jgi:hypothetical protein
MMLAGMRQRPLSEGIRLLQTAGQRIRLPQGETIYRLSVSLSPCEES